MNNLLYVKIPKNDFYTLYAEGVTVGLPTKIEQDYELCLSLDYTVILYFTFRTTRRAYICLSPERQIRNIYSFSCTNRDLAVLAQLRGRSFDRFKRIMEYAVKETQARCYRYRPIFFWQLSYLAQNAKNDKYNIDTLIERYELIYRMEKNITEKK